MCVARHVEKLPVEKYEHYWGRLHYEGDFCLEGFLSFHKSNLYFQPIDEEFKKIRVDYAEIIWCEERTNVFGEIGIVIITNKKKEYHFISTHRDYQFVEFLQPLIKWAKKRPDNLSSEEVQTSGEKIRRQYFNMMIYLLIGLETPLFLILFFDELLKNGLLIAFKEMGSALLVVGIWIIPLTILSILNRKHFGKIVCTMDEQGIYYRNELIPWNSIREIEYEIVLPSKRVMTYRIRNCYAHVKGKSNVIILSAPYYLLQRAKEYNPAIKVDFSKSSKSLLRLFCGAILIFMMVMLGTIMQR